LHPHLYFYFQLAGTDADGPDEGTRGDQSLFGEAVEASAVEVDHARGAEGSQGAAVLPDEMVDPLVGVRDARLSGIGGTQEDPLGQRRAGPYVDGQHPGHGQQDEVGQQELQAQVVRVLEGLPEAQAHATHRKEPDHAPRGDEDFGEEQDQPEGE